jgi:hypothetical protein
VKTSWRSYGNGSSKWLSRFDASASSGKPHACGHIPDIRDACPTKRHRTPKWEFTPARPVPLTIRATARKVEFADGILRARGREC